MNRNLVLGLGIALAVIGVSLAAYALLAPVTECARWGSGCGAEAQTTHAVQAAIGLGATVAGIGIFIAAFFRREG